MREIFSDESLGIWFYGNPWKILSPLIRYRATVFAERHDYCNIFSSIGVFFIHLFSFHRFSEISSALLYYRAGRWRSDSRKVAIIIIFLLGCRGAGAVLALSEREHTVRSPPRSFHSVGVSLPGEPGNRHGRKGLNSRVSFMQCWTGTLAGYVVRHEWALWRRSNSEKLVCTERRICWIRLCHLGDIIVANKSRQLERHLWQKGADI